MARTGAQLGKVTRVTASGGIYVELAAVAPGFEFGPCLDTVGGLVVGDRVIAQALARDPDELVITGILGGRDYAPLEHQHHADDLADGVLSLNRLPVAPSGNPNPTQIVRADDARLSDARPPTAHTHVTSGNYTPAVTSDGGPPATFTAAGSWARIGDLVGVSLEVNISAVGAASGALYLGVPFPAVRTQVLVGRENAATGNVLQGVINAGASSAVVFTFNNALVIGAPRVYLLSGVYLAQPVA